MSTIDTSQLLTQLRLAAAQAKAPNPAAAAEQAPNASANFSSLLNQSLDKVNSLQQASSQAQDSFAMGDPNVSLSQVMIAKSKSGLAFDATLRVRNKMVEAYQEIMRMPV